MTLVEAVRARQLAITALIAIVGTRIYTLVLPQSPTLPAVRVQQIDRIETMHLRGTQQVCRARVQVDFVASKASSTDPYTTAHAAAKAARGAFVSGAATGLAGWKGVIAGSPPFEVASMRLVDEREIFEPEELQQVMVSQDYMVTFVTP